MVHKISPNINVKNGKDLITVDTRLHQIRYLHDVAKRGRIDFIDVGKDSTDAYDWLVRNDRKLFKKSLAEDVKSNINKAVVQKRLRIVG